jgi:hypothetical protein
MTVGVHELRSAIRGADDQRHPALSLHHQRQPTARAAPFCSTHSRALRVRWFDE